MKKRLLFVIACVDIKQGHRLLMNQREVDLSRERLTILWMRQMPQKSENFMENQKMMSQYGIATFTESTIFASKNSEKS